eukprot:1485552-Rhodomonas_salina.2
MYVPSNVTLAPPSHRTTAIPPAILRPRAGRQQSFDQGCERAAYEIRHDLKCHGPDWTASVQWSASWLVAVHVAVVKEPDAPSCSAHLPETSAPGSAERNESWLRTTLDAGSVLTRTQCAHGTDTLVVWTQRQLVLTQTGWRH